MLEKAVHLIPFRLRSTIKNIPGIKQLQAFLVKRMLNNKEFVTTISGGPAKGLRFPVKMPQDKQMWIGTWELEFAEMLASQVKPGGVCFDIGGYKGYYAGVMALHGASRVYVFEPMPGNAVKIAEMIKLNPALDIRLVQKAVSDSVGKTVFKLMPEETMGKLEKSSFQGDEKFLQEIDVEVTALDEFTKQENQFPDFMKIDVEGAEEFVLTGAVNLLNKKKPVLMIEIHSREIGRRCYTLLKEIYQTVFVLETGKTPAADDPEICHYIVKP